VKSLHPVLAVPAIAVIDAAAVAAYAAFEAATIPGSLFSPGNAAWITFAYATPMALAAGCLLAVPFWYFGYLVPRPRGLWLTAIGAAVGVALALIFGGKEGIELAITMALIGALSGLLWWTFVGEGRDDLWPDNA